MVNETRAVPLPEANTKTTHFFFFVSGKRSHTKHGKMGREFNVPHPAMPAKILDSDSYIHGVLELGLLHKSAVLLALANHISDSPLELLAIIAPHDGSIEVRRRIVIWVR